MAHTARRAPAQKGQIPLRERSCLSLLYVLELTPDEEAVGVVRQRAGLQRHDVLALHRIEHREGVRGDDELPEDFVSVRPALRVGYVELVTLLRNSSLLRSQKARWLLVFA